MAARPRSSAQRSAGVLLYRLRNGEAEVLLVHPGGPFWAKKDAGAWSVPKGLIDAGEDALAAARREFAEETGMKPQGDAILLGDFSYISGKIVTVFALRGDFEPAALRSNTFTMEWPPRSGRTGEFPEVDRAAWFPLAAATEKIIKGQRPALAALAEQLGRDIARGEGTPAVAGGL
jgi:predicted NUDIX family NTP pyrophosphohydrolase